MAIFLFRRLNQEDNGIHALELELDYNKLYLSVEWKKDKEGSRYLLHSFQEQSAQFQIIYSFLGETENNVINLQDSTSGNNSIKFLNRIGLVKELKSIFVEKTSTCSLWCLEPHDKQSYRTTQLPIFYDPKAAAPRFEQFLYEVFEGDEDAEAKKILICELLGYSLLTSCEFEKFIILLGSGANGKSVLLHIVEQLVGTSQVAAVQPSQFDNRFQRAHLFGKLVNIVTEIAEGAEIADAALKAIVSGERTTAEHKHKSPFDFHPFSTCWFGTNHMPHCRDFSDALFRRAIILSFNRKFEGAHRDVNLRDFMTSHKQIVANQCNALKSTGPRTEDGRLLFVKMPSNMGFYARKSLSMRTKVRFSKNSDLAWLFN